MSTNKQTAVSLADERGWFRALQSQVPQTTFKKGREVAQSRRVLSVEGEPEKISARIQGSEGQTYQVTLVPKAAELSSSCECEAWNQYGPHCKHVVAAALAYLATRLPDKGDETASSEPPVAGGGEKASSEGPGRDEQPVLPALAKLESWLGLSALPDYELFYRLSQVKGPTGTRLWLVDVRRQDAQAKGPVQVKRMLAQGARLSPADERIFLALARHESRFDSRILVSDEDLGELLDLLKERKVIYRGTPLVFESEPARAQVHLESRPDVTSARIELSLPDGKGVELKDAILLSGRKSFAIIGQSLYRLEPDFPPRLLRKWLLEPRMSFPPAQVDRLLSFFAAHLPRFQLSLKADGLVVDETTPPKFIFTAQGTPEAVMAQLGARYGNATVRVSPLGGQLGYAMGASDSGRMLFRRREAEERAAAKRLLELGFKYDPSQQTFHAAHDAAVEFWARGIATLPEGWERFEVKSPKVRLRPRLRPRVKVALSGVNWFELDADFATEDHSVDLGAVRMWLDSGRKFIPLKDGSFAEADPEELKRAADLLEEAGALPGQKKTRLPLQQAVALDLLAELGSSAEIEAKAKKAMNALKEVGQVPIASAPPGLKGELRHYQEQGLSWLWFLHRNGLSGILADDMGLGKTIQALTLLLKSKVDEGPKPSLVVAPTSVLANWEREAERFTPDLKTFTWHGQDRKERADQLSQMDLVLTSYALVRRDGEELSKVGFRYVILDEAQNIKNADSATAQACKAIVSDQRLALTGTPLENRLSELWSIFDFLMPGFLGSQGTFGERYEQPIQVASDAAVRERLRRRIRPFVLRRLKSEVATDLPPKTESVAYCEMELGQATLYREVLEQSRRKIHEAIEKVGFKRSRVSILAALMKLRQVCCDPRLLKLPPGTLLPPSAKLERFAELVSDLVAEGHRALVFSQFTEMLELLKQHADAKQIGYQYLDGRTKDRMARVDRFNDPAGPPLFFISLKAGGTGLNLTAADYVIHYDPWWNPAVEDQATDRTHRIGQTKAVISYKLITRHTVEEKILALQQRKRELAAGVLGPGTEWEQGLSEQDIEELFRD